MEGAEAARRFKVKSAAEGLGFAANRFEADRSAAKEIVRLGSKLNRLS